VRIGVEERETRVRAPDVAGQDHGGLTLGRQARLLRHGISPWERRPNQFTLKGGLPSAHMTSPQRRTA
jgi:hypothetical protein